MYRRISKQMRERQLVYKVMAVGIYGFMIAMLYILAVATFSNTPFPGVN